MLKYGQDPHQKFIDEISVKNRIIKELQREFTDCRDQLNSALRYGFERNQENRGLHQRIMGLMDKIEEDLRDGKNRVHGDK